MKDLRVIRPARGRPVPLSILERCRSELQAGVVHRACLGSKGLSQGVVRCSPDQRSGSAPPPGVARARPISDRAPLLPHKPSAKATRAWLRVEPGRDRELEELWSHMLLSFQRPSRLEAGTPPLPNASSGEKGLSGEAQASGSVSVTGPTPYASPWWSSSSGGQGSIALRRRAVRPISDDPDPPEAPLPELQDAAVQTLRGYVELVAVEAGTV